MEPTRVSHFELIRRIGRGGMGEVYEATDLKLRRRVAIKFLSSELALDPAALTRFEREALAAAELNHPHIATVYAFEQDGDRPFIAMELLAGPSLRDHIAAGTLPVAEALAIARDVAAALAYAHRRGTSHRDIKPENLMFDEHGEIKIMDFGLARASMASKLTVTGTSLGTPAYMSPEALRGETGPAGDVFALGLVLYEMLAGHRAYPGDNAMAVMFAIANEAPPPLRGVRPEVTDEVESLVTRLLAKDPAQRLEAAAAAKELGALTGVSMTEVRGLDAALRTGAGAGAHSGVAASGLQTVPIRVAASGLRTVPIGNAGLATSSGVPAAALTDVAIPVAGRARPRRWMRVGVAIALFILIGAAGLAMVSMASRRRDQALVIEQRGEAARKAGHGTTARALFEQAVKLDPGQAAALIYLGLFAMDDHRFAVAESLFNAVIDHHPKDPQVLAGAFYNRGDCRLETDQYAAAVEDLRSAIALDSSTSNVYNNLGFALIQNGQPDEALTVVKRGIARFPGEKYLFKTAGQAAIQLGDPAQALTYLDHALKIDPHFSQADSLRGRAIALVAPGGQ